MAIVNVNLTGIVTLTGIQTNAPVRVTPSINSSIKANAKKDETLKISKQSDKWYYVDRYGGWIQSSFLSITVGSAGSIVNISESDQKILVELQNEKIRKEEAAKAMQELELLMQQTVLTDTEIVDSLLVNNLNGVYGIPYQFMESVDPRLSNSVMGRKYSEKIVSKLPLLCITPGKTGFMSNFSKDEQTGLLAKLVTDDKDTPVSDIISKDGTFYTFVFDYTSYFDYVNPLCRNGARFLNIDDLELNIGGEKAQASAFDWSKALNSSLKATLTSQEFIGFYVDSVNTVSEQFTNDTTQSQIASAINEAGGTLARELGFLLGAGAQDITEFLDDTLLEKALDGIQELTDHFLKNKTSILSDITGNFKTIASGGKLIFPEIWSDSTFSRSFNIDIKLRTPDSDVVSWYINIYVPLCHLIALAAGHQTDNPNGYYSPFLVRAFYKGLFNIDMGIITDLNITKGKESAWTIDGLPTEVDVSITIKDLYNMMSIVPGSEPKNFVTNNLLMGYIANTCGININQMDIKRSLEIYYILTKTKITDIPGKVKRKFQDLIDTYGMNTYTNAISKFLI